MAKDLIVEDLKVDGKIRCHEPIHWTIGDPHGEEVEMRFDQPFKLIDEHTLVTMPDTAENVRFLDKRSELTRSIRHDGFKHLAALLSVASEDQMREFLKVAGKDPELFGVEHRVKK